MAKDCSFKRLSHKLFPPLPKGKALRGPLEIKNSDVEALIKRIVDSAVEEDRKSGKGGRRRGRGRKGKRGAQGLTNVRIKHIVKMLDSDGSGTISFDEFVSYVSKTKRELQQLASDAARHWRKQSRAGTGAADLFAKMAGPARKGGQHVDFTKFRQAMVQLPLNCGTLTEGEMRTLFAQARISYAAAGQSAEIQVFWGVRF